MTETRFVNEQCDACGGYGQVEIGPVRDPSQFANMGTCHDCDGTGIVEVAVVIQLDDEENET